MITNVPIVVKKLQIINQKSNLNKFNLFKMKVSLFSSSKKSSLDFENQTATLLHLLYRQQHQIICGKNDTGLMGFIYNKSSEYNIIVKGETDVCIILPGGIGTLYEMLEMIYFQKPILIYNIDGFYSTFIEFIDELKTLEYIDSLNLTIANNIEEVENWLTMI
jgi:hypothetical protein